MSDEVTMITLTKKYNSLCDKILQIDVKGQKYGDERSIAT